MCPGLSVADAKRHVIEEIAVINERQMKKRGLFMQLQIYMSTSWLEIHLLRGGSGGG